MAGIDWTYYALIAASLAIAVGAMCVSLFATPGAVRDPLSDILKRPIEIANFQDTLQPGPRPADDSHGVPACAAG
jgi:hypothetical protein